MCWTTKIRPVLQIAEEDIKVQKILAVYDDNDLRSPIYPLCWNRGIVCKIVLRNPNYYDGEKYTINSGINSAFKIRRGSKTWISCYGRNEESDLFVADDYEQVFDAIIPKGSEYYVNEFGEIVSNQLMIL